MASKYNAYPWASKIILSLDYHTCLKKKGMDNLNISPIEQYVIDKVREMRMAKKMSQRELANQMDFSNGFIGNAESPRKKSKYNLNHLNSLAKIFNCAPGDFLPAKPLA